MKSGGLGSLDLMKVELNDIINQYGDILFQEITNLFNFVFAYKNEGEFDPVDFEWVKENISVRILKEIALGLADMNNIKDVLIKNLFPFFQNFFLPMFLKKFNEMANKQGNNMENGNSTIN